MMRSADEIVLARKGPMILRIIPGVVWFVAWKRHACVDLDRVRDTHTLFAYQV